MLRPLQFLQSLSISIGMAFATSCFAMVAGMANKTGPWVVPAIGISMLIVLTVAQAIGALAKRFPSALGIRTYIKAAFGNTASLFCVFIYLLMIALIAGVESNMFAGVVRYVFPSLDGRIIIGGVFALIATMNLFGFEFSKRVQLVMVMALLTGVLALAACALSHSGLSGGFQHPTSADQLTDIPPTVIAALFLFVGFEWVTSAQSGSRNAATQLPTVLTTSVVLLGVVYMAFAAAAVANLDPATLAATDKPQMLLAQQLWGAWGARAVLVLGSLTVLTSFNAGVLGASRLIYSLARERVLPKALATATARTGAPVMAIVVTTLVSFGSALAALNIPDKRLLSGAAAVIICICYCALLAASLKLAKVGITASLSRTKHTAQCVALFLMAVLMAALLLYGDTVRQGAIVLVFAGLSFSLALFTSRRITHAGGLASGFANSGMRANGHSGRLADGYSPDRLQESR